ncbi:TPA: hypothetical protein ACGIM3_000624 [Salmonella enterica subsp. enterica serovar Java]
MQEDKPGPGPLNDHRLASYAAWMSLVQTLHEQGVLDTELLKHHLMSHVSALRACSQSGAAGSVMEYSLAVDDRLHPDKKTE